MSNLQPQEPPRGRYGLTRSQAIGVWGGLAGAVFGSTLWIIALAGLSHDWLAVALTLVLDIAVLVVAGQYMARNPRKRFLAGALVLVILMVHCLGLFWWRVDGWRQGIHLAPGELARQKKLVTITVTCMMAILLAQFGLMHWLSNRARKQP